MGGQGSGGSNRKPRQVCACGVENSRASTANGQPYRCRACYGLSQRGPRTPARTCVQCGALFHYGGAGGGGLSRGRRCCSDACAKARSEEAKDRQRVSPRELLRRRRAHSRRERLRRRAAFKAIGASIKASVGRWRRICARDGWVCWICKGRIDPSKVPSRHRRAPSVDHVIPVGAPDWSDDDANLRAAHYGCNATRGNAMRNAGQSL
jgi:hypothetical protein